MKNYVGPIFIIGCGRSGTTLLRLILNRHSRIAIPEETWFFPQLERELPMLMQGEWKRNVAHRLLELNKIHFPDITVDTLEDTLSKTDSTDISSIIACVNREYMTRTGKYRWGDKTPGYVMHLPLIKALYPEAKVIHMIRDGRDVIPSILKYWSVGPQTTSLIETAFYWKEHVSRGVEFGPKLFGENYMELKYEDLASQPEGHIQKVCDFIGEFYEDTMMDSNLDRVNSVPDWTWHEETQKQINNKNVGKWRKNLSNYEVMVIQNICGDLLRKFEYDMKKWFSMRALIDVNVYRFMKWSKDKYLSLKVGTYNFLVSSGLKKLT